MLLSVLLLWMGVGQGIGGGGHAWGSCATFLLTFLLCSCGRSSCMAAVGADVELGGVICLIIISFSFSPQLQSSAENSVLWRIRRALSLHVVLAGGSHVFACIMLGALCRIHRFYTLANAWRGQCQVCWLLCLAASYGCQLKR